MSTFFIESTRGGRRESEHLVSLAVVDTTGRLLASAGDCARETYWRSAAKPLQALALVDEGAADRFQLSDEALALACASHSSEPCHLAVASEILAACDCGEDHLACGPHPPLTALAHVDVTAAPPPWRPLGSNCSGKHAAMLALARHLDLDLRGYEREDHPLQRRILDDIARTTGQSRADIGLATDGCRAVTFFVSLAAMARAWAYFGASADEAPRRLREACWRHPTLVAGTGRPCTRLLEAGRGTLLVKVGAEGVYCAALPQAGLGVALKVESGDMRAAPVALCAALADLEERLALGLEIFTATLADLAETPLRDTRGEIIGSLRRGGQLTLC
ncbi:MAG: asparaginase [Myxococcota bacterium]